MEMLSQIPEETKEEFMVQIRQASKDINNCKNDQCKKCEGQKAKSNLKHPI